MTGFQLDLGGRLALVTGANRGLGLAIAEALARAGADIIAVSSSIEPAGTEVERRVAAFGRHCETRRLDLSDGDAAEAFGAELAERHPPIDILINNAGTIRRGPAADHSRADWEHVLATDLGSQFLLTRPIGRSQVARGYGKIIFTASVLSFQGGITVPGYAAAKHGLVGLTKALANEWAGSGVNVNAIAPGYIATDNNVALRNDPERSRQILDRIPAGRWGTAEDVAGAAVFLASDAARYVHGTVLAVDGGWLAR
ncbi:SDR family oxidoreductase [Microlunatus sp. GCM10028923]|uniref:SDR family oxidoreductase n=1 Tax=Microlunatus sp. GCM10028923 TaxID=3273400 RepID=UPI003611E35C